MISITATLRHKTAKKQAAMGDSAEKRNAVVKQAHESALLALQEAFTGNGYDSETIDIAHPEVCFHDGPGLNVSRVFFRVRPKGFVSSRTIGLPPRIIDPVASREFDVRVALEHSLRGLRGYFITKEAIKEAATLLLDDSRWVARKGEGEEER